MRNNEDYSITYNDVVYSLLDSGISDGEFAYTIVPIPDKTISTMSVTAVTAIPDGLVFDTTVGLKLYFDSAVNSYNEVVVKVSVTYTDTTTDEVNLTVKFNVQ